jgi:hypothetical protein
LSLSFSIFVNDIFGAYYGSSGLGGEVLLLNSTGSSVVATLYGPNDAFETGGNPNNWVTVTNMNITADVVGGTTYQLQFLESDATGPINVGIDGVSLVATSASVPEPDMLIPIALLAAFCVFRARRFSAAGVK